eukprot:6704325-Pyramimonas_sp.AAC.1
MTSSGRLLSRPMSRGYIKSRKRTDSSASTNSAVVLSPMASVNLQRSESMDSISSRSSASSIATSLR